ncbi:MAG: hypothetical protein C4527_27700 [Candidatus Omnitrophota bacterium]|jgi:uncharacterized membrane protein|nr:MAG: hypothetical protein C4527_27700 [Candidatus Omnitrophota bacterium]
MMNNHFKEWMAGSRIDELVDTHFIVNAPLGIFTYLMVVVVGGLLLFLYYRPRLTGLKPAMRVWLMVSRAAIFGILFLLLLDVCLVGYRIEPGDRYVILLFDDSKSMRVFGDDGRSRGERLLDVYENSKSAFEERLQKKFKLARYRFGESLEILEAITKLDFSQTETDLIHAVRESLQEFEGIDLAGIVLFSDGIQQTTRLSLSLDSDLFNNVPTFVVGTDNESNWQDLRIHRIGVKRSHFDRSPVLLDVELQADGLKGESAMIEVIEQNKIVVSKMREITEDAQLSQVRLEFVPEKSGWIDYEVRVRVAEPGSDTNEELVKTDLNPNKERVLENNCKSFLIDNTEKTYRILFYSGRPNWEHKFVRRSLLEDKQLEVRSLILLSRAERQFVYRGARTTVTNPLYDGFESDQEKYGRYDEPIFLRLGVEESELVKGYPKQAEELFSYHLIIMNEMEPQDFTTGQLELTRDFVDKRGGALLLLGGKRAFIQGRFAGSVFESMFPVLLLSSSGNTNFNSLQELFSVRPTVEGEISGAWTLSSDPADDRNLWQEMPELFGLNRFALTRPGASVWARARIDDSDGDDAPVFILQRYGNGKCAILATGETWQWQMQRETEDNAHERLWRQMVRSLVADVPAPIMLRERKDEYRLDARDTINLYIRDRFFDEGEGARVDVTITTPSGQRLPLDVEESIQEIGVFAAEWNPAEVGMHQLTMQAMDAEGNELGSLEEAFMVNPDHREFDNARYDPAFLRELAEKSGGKFFSLSQLADVADQIPFSPGRESEVVRLQIWHNPAFLILLFIFMTSEWYLRRRRGLP